MLVCHICKKTATCVISHTDWTPNKQDYRCATCCNGHGRYDGCNIVPHTGLVFFTNGCFDSPRGSLGLHTGHRYLFNWIMSWIHCSYRDMSSRLVVAVNDDESVNRLKGNTRPMKTIGDRLYDVIDFLEDLKSFYKLDTEIDVLPFDGSVDRFLLTRQLFPDMLIKGNEYKGSTKRMPGSEQSHTVVFSPMVPGISTTILEKEYEIKHRGVLPVS